MTKSISVEQHFLRMTVTAFFFNKLVDTKTVYEVLGSNKELATLQGEVI